MKQTLKRLFFKIRLKPFRFSSYFYYLNEFFSYSDREKFLWKVFDYARSNNLEGDYLEFGLYVGSTFIAAHHFSKLMGKNLSNMRFIGFDSFEGLPAPKGPDKDGFEHFKEGEFAFSYNSFVENLRRNHVNLSKVKLIKGFYNKSLNSKNKAELKIKKAAIIYIDSDLYESAVPVLNFVKDYLQDGTIIAFDDWFFFRGDPKKGEQRAFSEFLRRNKDIIAIPFLQFSWGGNSFIIRKKN